MRVRLSPSAKKVRKKKKEPIWFKCPVFYNNFVMIDHPVSRRDYARFPVDFFAVLLPDKENKVSIKVKNISARGLCGRTFVSLIPEQRLKIILPFPFSDAIFQKEVRVVWCAQKENGLWESGFDFGLDDLINLEPFVKNGKLKLKR